MKRLAVIALVAGCILGCSRQVEVVDTAEQAKQREDAAKHFDDMKYTDLSQPLGAKKADDKDKADAKPAEAGEAKPNGTQ